MKKIKLDYKKLFFSFLLSLAIILLFALFDFIAHSFEAEYNVPSRYFTNKIIYGAIIGFIAILFASKQNFWKKSLIFSASVSILLQIRYFLEGYPLDFVVLFLFIHFIILIVITMVLFRIIENKKIKILY